MSSQLFRPCGATTALIAGGANVALVPSTMNGANAVRIVASTTNVYLGNFNVNRTADLKIMPGEVVIVKCRPGETVNVLPAVAGAQCNLWVTTGCLEGSEYGWAEEQS